MTESLFDKTPLYIFILTKNSSPIKIIRKKVFNGTGIVQQLISVGILFATVNSVYSTLLSGIILIYVLCRKLCLIIRKIYWGWVPSRNRVVVPARHATL